MYSSPWIRRLSCVLLVAVVSLLNESAVYARPAGPQELPKAEDVLEAAVKAIGGREAWEKHKSMAVVMKGKIVGQDMALSMATKQKAPNLSYLKLSIQGIFEQEMGFDGKVAWSKDPFTGERELEGIERAQAVRQAVFNAPLKWKQIYKKVQTLGIEKVDGRECIVVQLTPKEGHPAKHYFDKNTLLLFATETKSESAMGEQTARSRFMDYKETGGVLVAHTVKIMAGANNMELKLDKIEWDVKVDDALFKKPWGDKGEKKTEKKTGGDAGKSGQSS